MNEKRSWLYDLLFILVLLMAGYLRLAGFNWGEGYHQHPDELFLSGVLDNLRAHACEDPLVPVDACPPEQQRWMSIGEYFDSDTSTLSPYNRGHAFFVYGNLPMTLVRVGLEMTDTENSKYFARQMSALADLFTIFILYLMVSSLYGRKVGTPFCCVLVAGCDADPAVTLLHLRPVRQYVHVPRAGLCGEDRWGESRRSKK